MVTINDLHAKISELVETNKDRIPKYKDHEVQFDIRYNGKDIVPSKVKILVLIKLTTFETQIIKSEEYDDIQKAYIDIKNRVKMEIEIKDKIANFNIELRKDKIEQINKKGS